MAISRVKNWANGEILTASDLNAEFNNILNFLNNTTSFPIFAPLDISAATAGRIIFPAAQVPSADANTLDDYEEGTFTPTLSFGGGTTGIVYVAQAGSYTKVGNLVSFQAYFQLSNKGSSTGAAEVNGLPFTSTSTANTYNGIGVVAFSLGTILLAQGLVFPNNSYVRLYVRTAGALTALANTDFTNASELVLTGQYRV